MIIACPWCPEGSGSVLSTGEDGLEVNAAADGTVTVSLADLDPGSIAHVKAKHPVRMIEVRH